MEIKPEKKPTTKPPNKKCKHDMWKYKLVNLYAINHKVPIIYIQKSRRKSRIKWLKCFAKISKSLKITIETGEWNIYFFKKKKIYHSLRYYTSSSLLSERVIKMIIKSWVKHQDYNTVGLINVASEKKKVSLLYYSCLNIEDKRRLIIDLSHQRFKQEPSEEITKRK